MRVFRMTTVAEHPRRSARGGSSAQDIPSGPEPSETPLSFLELQRRRLMHNDDAYPHDLPLTGIQPLSLCTGIGVDTASEHSSWAIRRLRADRSRYSGKGVSLAILDSGVDLGHHAFKGLVVSNEDYRDFLPGGDTQPDSDKLGHGTLCASVAVGRDVNRHRIGVAHGVRRLIVGKVTDGKQTVGAMGLRDAIRWAYNRGAHIITMSLGLDVSGIIGNLVDQYAFDDVLATRIAADEIGRLERGFGTLASRLGPGGAQEKGALLIAAAGNASKLYAPKGMRTYMAPAELPASANAIVSVAATTPGDKFASFSSGPADWVAPGEDVCGAKAGTTDGLVRGSGSSLACGLAAGIAALWWQRELERSNRATADDVRSAVKNSLTQVDEPLHNAKLPLLVQAPIT